MEAFISAIQDAVLEEGAKQFYSQAGFKTHTGLLQYINPNDEEHCLKVKNLLLILQHLPEASRYRVLRALVGPFGYELEGREKVEPQALTSALLHTTTEMADVTRAIADAIADQRVTQLEKAKIRRNIEDVRASLALLESSVQVA